MLNTRGTIVLSLVVMVITILVMGFSDKLKPQRSNLCDSVKTATIDRCARMGGAY